MEKSTGIIRDTDKLGRIVIPMEFRKIMDIAPGDSMEIISQDDTIIMKKYRHSCVFCSGTDKLAEYKGKHICASCLSALQR